MSIPSPCTDVCALGADGLCAGCQRTLAEIAAWGSASDAEKRRILALLPGRRAR